MGQFSFENRTIVIIFWVVIIVIWYHIYSSVEPRHNQCWGPRRNECGVEKFRVDPRPGDTNADLLKRLEGYTRLNEEVVLWRRSLLNAILIAALGLMIFHRKLLIPIKQFFIAMLIIFVAFYFHNSYYMMHFDLRSNIYTQATINEIRYRLNLMQRPGSPDLQGSM